MERLGRVWAQMGADGAGGAVCAVEGGAAERAASVDSVGLNYLQKNVAPVVDEMVVQPGARVAATAAAPANATVQVAFPPAAGRRRR